MNSPPDVARFRIRRAEWPRDRDALRRVRSRVFIEEQGVPAALEWDADDENAVHLLAEDSLSDPIGTARLLSTGQIGRMAVLERWRGRGVGSALLREILSIALADGRPRPFLNAQTSALPFYRRAGFLPVGPEFLEAGIPHQKMNLP